MACRLPVTHKTRQKLLFNLFWLLLFSALFAAIVFSLREAIALVIVRSSQYNDFSTQEKQLSWESVEESNLEIVSKCSRKADARGRGQKVTAFSLYGELSDPSVSLFRYVEALIENAHDFASKYPGNELQLCVTFEK